MTAAPAIFWHIASPDQPIVSLALPPKLFYVRHRYSQACETEDGGFISRNPGCNIWKEEDLKINAMKHFGWYNWDYDSCFISVFGDQRHAENWAKRPGLREPVMLYEVDTAKLPPGTLVLNVHMLCAHLGIEYEYNQNLDEFLFYQGIPGCCVGGSWDRYQRGNLEGRPRWPYMRWGKLVLSLDKIPSSKRNLSWRENLKTNGHTNAAYQLSWGSVASTARQQQTEYKEAQELANSQSDEEADQEPGAGEDQQESAENDNTSTVPDEEVNSLVGQMEALDLQTNIDTHTNLTTTVEASSIEITTTASTATGVDDTVPQNPFGPRSAESIRRERRKQRELEELERERQKVAELDTEASNDSDVNDIPVQDGRERQEELELEGEDVHMTGSGSDTATKPNAATAIATDTTETGSGTGGLPPGC